jgi:hypothetical protein
MSDNHGAACNRDTLLENFAAELTSAVYPIMLRHGIRGSWIKVELGLWRELAETLKKWAREWPPPGPSDEFTVWRECLLADLTEGAFFIAVKHGINGPLLEVESGLSRALRSVIVTREETMLCRTSSASPEGGQAVCLFGVSHTRAVR